MNLANGQHEKCSFASKRDPDRNRNSESRWGRSGCGAVIHLKTDGQSSDKWGRAQPQGLNMKTIIAGALALMATSAPSLADPQSAAEFVLKTCLPAMDDLGKVEIIARENTGSPYH
jgi:hypothetical protein